MDTIYVLRLVSVVAGSDLRIVEVSLARQSSTWQMPVAISSSDSHKCFFEKNMGGIRGESLGYLQLYFLVYMYKVSKLN